MERSFYYHSEEAQYHLSVGMVLFNASGKVCMHFYDRTSTPADKVHHLGGLEAIYSLIRESVENGETLHQAVARGLLEETGCTGRPRVFLGSLRDNLSTPGGDFEKTTLYHAVELVACGERPTDDSMAFTELRWVDPYELIPVMIAQRNSKRPDLDESEILKRFIEWHTHQYSHI